MQTFLKFRIVLEEDELAIYRDIEILPGMSVTVFVEFVLGVFDFDMKGDFLFWKSNEKWQKLTEISVQKNQQAVCQLLQSPNQRFRIDYTTSHSFFEFRIESLQIGQRKTVLALPRLSKKKGVAPSQYMTKDLKPDNDIDFILKVKSSLR